MYLHGFIWMEKKCSIFSVFWKREILSMCFLSKFQICFCMECLFNELFQEMSSGHLSFFKYSFMVTCQAYASHSLWLLSHYTKEQNNYARDRAHKFQKFVTIESKKESDFQSSFPSTLPHAENISIGKPFIHNMFNTTNLESIVFCLLFNLLK